MPKLRHYLIANFSSLFFSVFLTLLTIASVIFMIKLSSYTAVIKISFMELLQLYLLTLPNTIFYTLPISFFVAAVLTLTRLSTDNEMIVLFSLGIKPSRVYWVFFKPALLLSLFLIFDFFIVMQHTKIISKNFIIFKKQEAQFNLSASEFGHNFNNWLLYIGDTDNNGLYKEVLLFNKNKNEEFFVTANTAVVETSEGVFRLKLDNGQGYSYSDDAMTQIDFRTMHINNLMVDRYHEYRMGLDFWLHPDGKETKIKDFTLFLLIALFPLLSLQTAMSIGIIHIRHEKGHTYTYMALALIFYYVMVFNLPKSVGFNAIPITVISWIIGSSFLYYRKIAKRF